MSNALLRGSLRIWMLQRSCPQATRSPVQAKRLGQLSSRNMSFSPRNRMNNTSHWISKPLPQSSSQRTTIYALSTPPGRGGIGVIRISGADARLVWEYMLVTPRRARPITLPPSDASRQLFRCRVVHPISKEVIDDGMAVFFHGTSGHSFLRLSVTITIGPFLQDQIHTPRKILSSCTSILDEQ